MVNIMHISNIGYIDDKLHIQTKWTRYGKDHGYFYFTDSEGDDIKIRPSTVHFGIDESGNTMDRGDYLEYVFDLGKEGLDNISVKGYFVSSGKLIEGDWKVEFELESVGQEKEVSYDLDFGTWQLKDISVSEIGVTLLGTGKYDENQSPKIIINMSDGTMEEITSIYSFTNNKNIYLKAIADQPFDTTAIESISINGDVVIFE